MLQNPSKKEKWDKPTYSLEEIKKLLANPKTRGITKSTHAGAFALGFVGEDEIVGVVNLLNEQKITNGGHFFKSLCVNEPRDMWHDIYKITLTNEEDQSKIYIKLQVDGKNGVVISFKKDEERYS